MNRQPISPQLREALSLYGFVERDIERLPDRGKIPPEALLVSRRALSQRLMQLALAIESDHQLANAPGLHNEMRSLLAELRVSWMRHRERFSVTDAASDLTGYLLSANEVSERSRAFRFWCDAHLAN